MAWPFTTVGAPNFDTGPGQAVPLTPTEIAGGLQTWLLGAHYKNESASSRTVTVTDSAGDVLTLVKLPAGAEQPYDWAFRPSLGVKWSADGANVIGHTWGYQ